MVPVKDLQAANEEKIKANEKIADLSARLHSAAEENEKLKSSILVSFHLDFSSEICIAFQ
jgi:cell shape-determining protein MreC